MTHHHRPPKVEYMARVAADVGASYKAEVLEALDLRPGHTVVDLGCGPGTDLGSMAKQVMPGGRVIGVDLDREMLAAAESRYSGNACIELVEAAAQRLPLESGSVDRVRCDRALQHMTDPVAVLVEAARVVAADGRIVVAEPDWSALAVRGGDPAIGQKFVRFTCDRVVRNARIGTQVRAFATAAGLTVQATSEHRVVIEEFERADYIAGLTRNSASAVRVGYIAEVDREQWLADLSAAPMSVELLMCITVLTPS